MENALTVEETQLRRLQWRCRRGMLEMDLLLENFIPRYFQQLNAAEQAAFDTLLDYPDNELWTMIVNIEQTNTELANKNQQVEMTSEIGNVLTLLQNCCLQPMN